MIPEIREALLRIGEQFEVHIDVETPIKDITLTGSMANYNYTQFSDLDIHLLVDFDLVDENTELVRKYFRAKSFQWNSTHDIQVKAHQAECYVQDINEPHHSTGVYSVLHDRWIRHPRRVDPQVDERSVQRKATELAERIDKMSEEGDLDRLVSLRERISKLRAAGLEKEGEYSTENLTFKVLRRSGHLGRLRNSILSAREDMLSLNGSSL